MTAQEALERAVAEDVAAVGNGCAKLRDHDVWGFVEKRADQDALRETFRAIANELQRMRIAQ